MANMDIKTDPVVSFFSLWSYASDELINPTTDRVFSFSELLKTFSSENIPLLEKTVPSIENLSVEEKIQLMKNFTRLSSDVCAGRYNSGENLIDDMVDIFQLNGEDKKNLTKAYESYKKFYDLNKKEIMKSKSALSLAYSEWKASDYFDKMYSFFQVDESKKMNFYLHHFPKKLMDSGYSTSECIHQNISLNRDEPEANYFKDTCILTRRMLTPIHEFGHFLFENSQSSKDAVGKPKSSANKLFQHLEKYFEGQNKKSPKSFAYAIIHEAFADSCGLFFKETTDPTFNPMDMKKINSNFKEVDGLTRIVYPIFKEYMQQNKPISNTFFNQVLNSSEFKKTFPVQKPIVFSKQR